MITGPFQFRSPQVEDCDGFFRSLDCFPNRGPFSGLPDIGFRR
jgi:hypothetical protein